MAADGYFAITDGRVGKRVKLPVTSAYVISENNANSAFQLHLSTPWTRAERSAFVLRVAGRTYRTFATGSQAGESRSYSFRITDLAEARTVAAHLGIQPHLRKHPGYLFAARFVTDKRQYRVGDPVAVTLEITNVGQKTVRFMDGGRNRGARNNQFSFAAELDNSPYPDTGNPVHFGGLAGAVALRPGERFTKALDLSDWYALDKPGLYSVVGSFYMEFVPVDDLSPVLWEDYVTAPFYFNMRP